MPHCREFSRLRGSKREVNREAADAWQNQRQASKESFACPLSHSNSAPANFVKPSARATTSFTYAALLTVNTWRSRPTNRTRLLFDERSGDQPEAMQTWYCPRDSRGLDFIYPTYDDHNQANYESQGGR
jgi:hypothetical protein